MRCILLIRRHKTDLILQSHHLTLFSLKKYFNNIFSNNIFQYIICASKPEFNKVCFNTVIEGDGKYGLAGGSQHNVILAFLSISI